MSGGRGKSPRFRRCGRARQIRSSRNQRQRAGAYSASIRYTLLQKGAHRLVMVGRSSAGHGRVAHSIGIYNTALGVGTNNGRARLAWIQERLRGECSSWCWWQPYGSSRHWAPVVSETCDVRMQGELRERLGSPGGLTFAEPGRVDGRKRVDFAYSSPQGDLQGYATYP